MNILPRESEPTSRAERRTQSLSESLSKPLSKPLSRRGALRRLGALPLAPYARTLVATSSRAVAAGRLAAMAGLAGLANMPGHAVAQSEGPRVALVIGNANYRVAPLENPVNDARLVTATLQELGFRVILVEDGSMRDMIAALRRWLVESQQASVRAFYFAGHGTQFRGRNFLVPVDLAIATESELERHALVLSDVVDAVSRQRQGVNFVIVDACRTDPSALLGRNGARTRSVDDPLQAGFSAQMAPRGTVVAFSTSPGALAADGAGSRNSVFTKALAQQMRQPGLPVESLFKRVRISVMRETRNAQVPWESSSLIGEFCFKPDANGQCDGN